MPSRVTIDRQRPPVIEITGLYKSFGSNHVLRGFDLRVLAGENVVVLGKSGSGKSVLIKCVIGLMNYDAGDLIVLGNRVAELGQRELDELRRRVGFLFQGAALYDSMPVRDNLEFPLRRHAPKPGPAETRRRVEEALTSVGLLEAMDVMPAELSGGMKKRVALARTLILRPEIILYDEPTSGLDPITGREISLLINHVQEEYKAASIIITHDLTCAQITANRIAVLAEGRNHLEGDFEELARSTDPRVHGFFPDLNPAVSTP
jgi:phospholipid/cholesterol/gamma-HCH transport system ATP-binding protein